jgi:uncharacterized membrane protein
MSASSETLNLPAARDQHRRAVRASEQSEPRWLAVLGGGLLAGYGLARGSFSGLLAALGGAGLAYYGLRGDVQFTRSVAPDGGTSQRIVETITINRSPAEIYDEWHDVTRLPRIMSHLVSVTETDDGLTHWVAKAPLGRTVEWNAEVIHDQESRIIAWRSVGDSGITNVGSVRFDRAVGGQGTEMSVTIEYNVPGGFLGVSLVKLLGEDPGRQIADDLRRFKQYMESGSYLDVDSGVSTKSFPITSLSPRR